jgi:hypothetical protein
MNDLLNKLNTLARARLNDALTNLPSLPRFERSPDLQRQVNDLRQRINAALDHEDELEGQVNTLREEIARLDAEADAAVAQGRDAEARYILEQLKRTEQRLSFAESDLKMHQRDAAELILKVNQLEAAVADHQAATSGMGDTTASTSDLKTISSTAASQSAASRLSAPTPPASGTAPDATSPQAANTVNPNTTSSKPVETPHVQPTRTQIPVESDSPVTSAVPVSSPPDPAASEPQNPALDTSIEANNDDLPEVTASDTTLNTANTTSAAPQPAVTSANTSAAGNESTSTDEEAAAEEDQPETAKSYAKRAREAAQQQADKTSTSVSQISDLIRDAQERTRARIQSLTDILEAKDREQAASPLYNREQPAPPSTTTSTTAAAPPENSTSTPVSEPQPKTEEQSDADKAEDALSERLKRLSKPE